MKKYNKAVAWSSSVDDVISSKIKMASTIKYSQHLQNRIASGKRNRKFTVANVLNKSALLNAEAVEIETDDGEFIRTVEKALLRYTLDDRTDLIVVLLFKGAELFIKTAWTNMRDDNHATLRADGIETSISGLFG